MSTLRQPLITLFSRGAIGRGVGFFANLSLTHFLGPSLLGYFTIIVAAVQLLDTLGSLGGDYSLNYLLGRMRAPLENRRGRLLVNSLGQICFLSTVAYSAVLFVWLVFFGGLFPLSSFNSGRDLSILLFLLMVLFEGLASAPWDALLVSRRISEYSLRQGFFLPARISLAAIGAYYFGLNGALSGWVLVVLAQFFWLASCFPSFPFPLSCFCFSFSFDFRYIRLLWGRGSAFYITNLISAIVSFPLVLALASQHGYAEVGFLRIGQILQQLFAFFSVTLSPLLFLRLRSFSGLRQRVGGLSAPFRLLWMSLLFVLIVYFLFDRVLLLSFFGVAFLPALVPTRILLVTALLEALYQVLVQPFLASGKTSEYMLVQLASIFSSGLLGYFLLPSLGISGYLLSRVILALLPFSWYLFRFLISGSVAVTFIPVLSVTAVTLAFCLTQSLVGDSSWPNALWFHSFIWIFPLFLLLFLERKGFGEALSLVAGRDLPSS